MTYNTNAITARVTVLNGALLAAGTYKSGQLLGKLTASGKFTLYVPGVSTGAQTITAVCLNDVTLAADGRAPVARGEFIREGVAAVMAGLASPVTLTDILVGQCWDAGIILN
ncbi:MAG: head decoration protein [Spirochaetaceae bacterium]|jgi:hypothetical protein|nr:head decoration protein [Spirochaetaceae bacterium]